MTDASRGQASPQHSLFGRSPQELLSEFPGQVPPPLQQIVAYLRRSDSFTEDPALFSVQSLAEKAFSEHIQDQTLVGLAQNKQEFHEYLRNPEAFPDPDTVQTARLFAQLLGRYLRSLPGLLISRHTSEIVAKKVMKEVVNAEKKGEVTNSVALSEMIHIIINQTQTQADVHTLRFLLNFFCDHVRSAAVFGSITPIDVAENVHEWIFNTSITLHATKKESDDNHSDSDGCYESEHEEIAEAFTLALAVLIENASKLGACPAVYANGSVLTMPSNGERHTKSAPGIEFANRSGPESFESKKVDIHDTTLLDIESTHDWSRDSVAFSTEINQTAFLTDHPDDNIKEFQEFKDLSYVKLDPPDNDRRDKKAEFYAPNDTPMRGTLPTWHYESEESDNKVGEIETASTKSNRVHSHVEQNALLFVDSVRNLSYSAKALASACADATKQATKMRYAFETSLQLVHATRKKVILESQNLVRMLSDSDGDSMQQLKHMNNMLQETQLQLLDEKAYSDKVLHEACNPELLGLTKQNALATEFMAKARQAQIFLGQCRADIINGSSKNSVRKMATDQHYPMNLDGRATEVKRLRAEVVRLRHTIHAYKKTEISEVNQSGSSDREVQPIMQHYASYRRESADTQVISELKSQVLALEEKLRASTRQGIFHVHSSALDSFTNFKFELESVRRNEQANLLELSKLKQEKAEISAKVSILKEKVRADVENSHKKYSAKCSELDHLRKQYSILQTTSASLKSLLTNQHGSVKTRKVDLANTKTIRSAQRVQTFPSSQDKIIDELRLQLMEAQSRVAIAEDDARIARHEASTIRRQYLDRVVDSRGEVNSMLSAQAQQHRQQSRAFGIKLLALQFYLTNKIKPMRKAFFQWFGHISAKQNGIVTKLYSKNLRELEVENIALSRALRASEMSNHMLEGLIASKESSKHQDVQTKIGSISRTQNLRVKMLEHDLSQIQRENQRLKSQHAKYLADQAMPNHHTQAQLPEMKSISNLMKSGATATASTSPHVSHANTVRTVAGGVQFYDPIESSKINEDLRKRSAEFLGFSILQASREDLGRQRRPTNTKPDNHSPPLDQQKCSRGGKHKPSNDLLDRIHKGHKGKNKLMETNKNQRHSTKRNWSKKGKQRRRKSLLLQKVV